MALLPACESRLAIGCHLGMLFRSKLELERYGDRQLYMPALPAHGTMNQMVANRSCDLRVMVISAKVSPLLTLVIGVEWSSKLTKG